MFTKAVSIHGFLNVRSNVPKSFFVGFTAPCLDFEVAVTVTV